MSNPLERYQNDPCAFVREILGVTTNYPKQDEILRSVRDNPRTALRTGNGCGKTVVAAQTVLWAAACFPDALVITTSATIRQVAQQLWAEIHRLCVKARRPLGGELLGTELRFLKTGSRAIGFATDDPGRFEGFHAKRILVIIDEAKSVPQEIFDAVERVLSAGGWVRLLVISTPGGPVGPFYNIFARQGHLYSLHHISAYDSPFIRREWIEERKREWGEESPLFQSAVMGEFPTSAQDGAVIQLAHLLRLQKHPPEPSGSELRAGIDLAAGGGDETVVAVFRGNQQVGLECWREVDTMATVGKIIEIIRRFGVPHSNVNIDADGLGGPIVDRLRELRHEFVAIHNGGEPQNKDRFVNAAAEMLSDLARIIELGEVALFTDDTLTAQLTSRRRKPRSDGRVQLESKEDMRRRGLPSPDRADAVALALASNRNPPPIPTLCVVNRDDSSASEDFEAQLRQFYQLSDIEADKIRKGQPALSHEAILELVWPKQTTS
jgi:hypothetical protein